MKSWDRDSKLELHWSWDGPVGGFGGGSGIGTRSALLAPSCTEDGEQGAGCHGKKRHFNVLS